VLEWIEDHTKPDRSVVSHIRSINPDVIVACPANHRFSEEIEYIKAGNELGIPTAIINYSWDNLTTKGTYHAKSDMFFVWNKSQAEDAVNIHSIPEESIVISGAPFFDKWFEPPKIVEDRARFCSRYGLNPDKPYVLYLGSSAKIAPNESKIIRRFLKYHQVLFRPHPANYKYYMLNMDLKIMPPDLIDDDGSRLEFAKAVRFSEFVFGINNSAMIDAVLNGGNCKSELLDEYYETQAATVHFVDMYTWMNHEDFERDFIWPCNFRAGFVISNCLEGLCDQST
jgi:hypothetical protein